MLHRVTIIAFSIFIIFLLIAGQCRAGILISEILADPPIDINKDGAFSTSNDEFIEILNFGNEPFDISGWCIYDAKGLRHIFDDNTILSANEYLVIFGGGSPYVPYKWQIASSGSLMLNNTGDTIYLKDNKNLTIDEISYGAKAGYDISLARAFMDYSCDFEMHTLINKGKSFSPGEKNVAAVPEYFSFLYLAFGLMGLSNLRHH